MATTTHFEVPESIEPCAKRESNTEELSTAQKSAISLLSCAFRAGVPLRQAFDLTSAKYGNEAWSTPVAQANLLLETVQYSPPNDFPYPFSFGSTRIARFLRLLMDEIDHLPSVDLSEELTEIAAETCQAASSPIEDIVWIVLRLPKRMEDSNIDIRDLPLAVSPRFSDLGLRIWYAGLVMYSHIIGDTCVRNDVKQKSVLELGAGTGLCAAAFADADVGTVLLTDISNNVVDNIQRNLYACKACSVDVSRIEVAQLDAADLDSVKSVAEERSIDTVLAADVSYDDEVAINMVQAFTALIKSSKIVGYLFATSRSENSDNLLAEQLQASKLFVEEIAQPVNTDIYHYLQKNNIDESVRVYRICSRQ